MLPPRPPSPPSGPPMGTYFSRRNDGLPSPPLPAMTSMRASSKNFIASSAGVRGARCEHGVGGLVEELPDAADPFGMLGLHQHRAQAGDRRPIGLHAGAREIEEGRRQLRDGEVQATACRLLEHGARALG